VADWSRAHGFAPDAVYQVLSGRTLALRGKAHHIAVALGIKSASYAGSSLDKIDTKENPM